jgi:hypothetical protein
VEGHRDEMINNRKSFMQIIKEGLSLEKER